MIIKHKNKKPYSLNSFNTEAIELLSRRWEMLSEENKLKYTLYGFPITRQGLEAYLKLRKAETSFGSNPRPILRK